MATVPHDVKKRKEREISLKERFEESITEKSFGYFLVNDADIKT